MTQISLTNTKADRSIEVAEALAGLLPSYPRRVAAQYAIGELIDEMCQTVEQVEALYKELRSGRYERWTGVSMIRGIYCDLFQEKAIKLADCPKCDNSGWFYAEAKLPDCPTCGNTGWFTRESELTVALDENENWVTQLLPLENRAEWAPPSSMTYRCDCGRNDDGSSPSGWARCSCGHVSSNLMLSPPPREKCRPAAALSNDPDGVKDRPDEKNQLQQLFLPGLNLKA